MRNLQVLVLSDDINIHQQYGNNLFCGKKFQDLFFTKTVDIDKEIKKIESICKTFNVTSHPINTWNIFHSKYLQDYLYVEYAKQVGDIDLIVCQNRGVEKKLNSLGFNCKIIIKNKRKNRILQFLHLIIKISKIIEFKYFIPNEQIDLQGNHLVPIFLQQGSIKNENFKNSFFKNELDDTDTIYIPIWFGRYKAKKIVLECFKSKCKFYIWERDIYWSEVIKNIIKVFKLWTRNLGDELLTYHWKVGINDTFFNSLLMKDVFARKSKKLHKIEMLTWFEAQPYEYALIEAFKVNKIRIKCLGYIGYFYSRQHLLSLQLMEKRCSELKILTQGEAQKRDFLNARAYKTLRFRKTESRIYNKKKKVSILLPFMSEQSIEILNFTEEIIRKLEEYKFVIHTHPRANQDIIIKRLKELYIYEIVEIFISTEINVLRESQISITSAGSVYWQSLIESTPVLIIGSKTTFTLSSVPKQLEEIGYCKICFNVTEALSIIKKADTIMLDDKLISNFIKLDNEYKLFSYNEN